jgi:nucleotide-binding universal stress UspA family protein
MGSTKVDASLLETTMYQRVLVATDGSKLSAKAVDAAVQWASVCGASLVALTVVPRYPQSYFEGGAAVSAGEVSRVESMWAEHAQKRLEKVRAQATKEGVGCKTVTVSSDLVAEAIISASKKHKCDLIIMASHGRKGIKRLLLGSETQHVLTHSTVPVLVLR